MRITYIIIPFYPLKNNQDPGKTPSVNNPRRNVVFHENPAENGAFGCGGRQGCSMWNVDKEPFFPQKRAGWKGPGNIRGKRCG